MEKKVKIKVRYIFFTIFLALAIYLIWFKKSYVGPMEDVQTLNGLKGNQVLITFEGTTGGFPFGFNPPAVNVSFFDNDFDSTSRGNVYWGYGAFLEEIKRISDDTVLIKSGRSMYNDYYYVEKARGITFIYEIDGEKPDPEKAKKY